MNNPAVTAALIAASRQQEVEEAVEGKLKKAKALGPSSAIKLELDPGQQKLLEQALAAGTVRREGEDRYYINERAIADRQEGQGFMALIVLLIVASLIASIAALAGKFGS